MLELWFWANATLIGCFTILWICRCIKQGADFLTDKIDSDELN